MAIENYKLAVALFLISTSLTLPSFLFSASADASIDNRDEEWKTAYTVGKFLLNEPPKPDQIFKVQYRTINGTIERFNAPPQNIITDVSSNGNGILEIRYPRNYPYTNDDMETHGLNAVLFFNGQPDGEIENYISTDDCFFVFSFPFTGRNEIGIAWTYFAVSKPFHGDNLPDSCIPQTIVENVPVRKDGTISPLHQFRAGVVAEDISCNGIYDKKGYHLVINPKGKPYCATDETIKFLNRVWYM